MTAPAAREYTLGLPLGVLPREGHSFEEDGRKAVAGLDVVCADVLDHREPPFARIAANSFGVVRVTHGSPTSRTLASTLALMSRASSSR